MDRIKCDLYAGTPTGKVVVDVISNELIVQLDKEQAFNLQSLYFSLKNVWKYQTRLSDYKFPIMIKSINNLIIKKPWKLIIQTK